MEAHLCVRSNSYLIFVRNFQKNEPERRSGLKKRTGTPFRCVPVQFEPCITVCCQDSQCGCLPRIHPKIVSPFHRVHHFFLYHRVAVVSSIHHFTALSSLASSLISTRRVSLRHQFISFVQLSLVIIIINLAWNLHRCSQKFSQHLKTPYQAQFRIIAPHHSAITMKWLASRTNRSRTVWLPRKSCSAAVHSTPCTSSSRGRTVADCASPSQCSQEPHTPLSTLELRSVRPPSPFLSYSLPSKIPDPPLATCIYR